MRNPRFGSGPCLSVLLTACIALSSCVSRHPESLPLLEKEVRAAVQEGMKTDEAIARLLDRDFSCLPKGSYVDPQRLDVRECSRSRGPIWPPYGCVQKVSLEFDPATQIISRLQIPQPACASL